MPRGYAIGVNLVQAGKFKMEGIKMGTLRLTFSVLLVMVALGLFSDAYPATSGSLEKMEEPLVIASVGFTLEPGSDKIMSWEEVKGRLAALKDIGVNTIFLWAPYEHPQKRITTIPCWVEENGRAKRIELNITPFNVIN